jgi:peptidoglycan hydrolase CwlO-like protein
MKEQNFFEIISLILPYISILIQGLFFWILKNIYDHIELKENNIAEKLNSIKENISLLIDFKEKEISKLSEKIEVLEKELNELKIEIAKLIYKINNGK